MFSTKKILWSFIYACCFCCFIVQISILAKDELYPNLPGSHKEEKHLDDIEFPILFKLCINPYLDALQLHKAGYRNMFHYFTGRSRFNGSIYGWAGHTEEGEDLGTVTGKSLN